MRFAFFFCISFAVLIPQTALALRCQMSSFDDFAVLPNTDDRMMVVGKVDADFVFDGVMIGPDLPDKPLRVRIAPQFREPPHPVWGGPILPTDFPLLAPLVRGDDGVLHFVGNMCQLLTRSANEEAIARVRACQRTGICPP